MPTFLIENPKSFVFDLLEYLKQAYEYLCMKNRKPKNTKNTMQGQILIPTLAPNHPQNRINNKSISIMQQQKQKDTDGVLNEYNRSKMKNMLEKNVNNENVIKYEFETNLNAVNHIVMVLKALMSVIKSNANVEIQCIGHFEMLFGFLSSNLCEQDREIKTIALEIISLVSRNKDCVSEIAACEILGQFLVALKDDHLKDVQIKVLETLSGLLNVQKMVKEAQIKGIRIVCFVITIKKT